MIFKWYQKIIQLIRYMIWYDMIWYDMIWYDMIWYDMIWYLNKMIKIFINNKWYYIKMIKIKNNY